MAVNLSINVRPNLFVWLSLAKGKSDGFAIAKQALARL